MAGCPEKDWQSIRLSRLSDVPEKNTGSWKLWEIVICRKKEDRLVVGRGCARSAKSVGWLAMVGTAVPCPSFLSVKTAKKHRLPCMGDQDWQSVIVLAMCDYDWRCQWVTKIDSGSLCWPGAARLLFTMIGDYDWQWVTLIDNNVWLGTTMSDWW